MSIKVNGGTPNSSRTSLCLSCTRASISRDVNGREHIRCHDFDKPINRKIVECTGYHDKKHAYLSTMREIAWTLETDRNRGPMGFAPPKHSNFYEPGNLID